jgi:phosphoglycolate phosphatase
MSALRLAVFDCDGTLIDGQASICAAMDAAFAEHGLPLPSRNEVRRAVGLSLPLAVLRLIPDAGADVRLGVTEAYKRHFRAARAAGSLEQPLFPGIAALLERLHATGWLLGVATGMSRRGLDHCLASHGLTSLFVTLQTADSHPSKPHPAMLEAALAEAGAHASRTVMIGDTAYDMAMASTIGVRALGVDWGYHKTAELLAAGAEAVAADLAELEEYLNA